ncbi:hypothetical protein MLD38_040541 [Melastoma candidum]|nr:hypothetical protein MLD38_040541 [Melastoma candidum]
MQAPALHAGAPPILRLMEIGPPSAPSPDGRDTLREIELRLAELVESVNIRFSFHGIIAVRFEDVKPWMLRVGNEEAVAINSIMQLHYTGSWGQRKTRRSPSIQSSRVFGR